eukprot:2612863-Pleurochrysis_carterae.AAC.2
MVLSKLRWVIVPRGWRCEGRLEAVRKRRGEGRAPRETAQVGSAPPDSAPDDRGPPRPHGRRQREAQPGAEEKEQASARLARHPRPHPGRRRAPGAPRRHQRAGAGQS